MKALGALLRAGAPASQPWRPADGLYPSLNSLAIDRVPKQPGVIAVWHLGARPRWLRVAGAGDLRALVGALRADARLAAAAVHGGLYVAWAPLPAAAVSAAVGSLLAQLSPHLQDGVAGEVAPLPPTGAMFPLPPGTQMPPPDA